MPIEAAPTTLREDLIASFDSVAPATIESQIAPAKAPEPVETDSQKADRLRDEAGRFAKADEKPQQGQTAQPATKPAAGEIKAAESKGTPPAPVTAPTRPPKPSSWKKDYDSHWETLDPTLAQYIHQREGEYAKGVSTYKQEADNARALNDAIAPFMPNLQKHGLEPTQWIRNLGTAHERLALGSPQEKVAMGAALIRDYGIDPQALFQALSQPQQFQQQQRPAPQPQVNFDQLIEQKLTEKEIRSEFNKFVAEAPEKYPHYEAVKETMAGLLQAGLAQDYKSAYDAALRHPRHEALLESERAQRQEQEQAAQAAKSQGVVNRARSQAVSVKSSTPTGNMAAANGSKSLRDSLSDAFDTVTASRV